MLAHLKTTLYLTQARPSAHRTDDSWTKGKPLVRPTSPSTWIFWQFKTMKWWLEHSLKLQKVCSQVKEKKENDDDHSPSRQWVKGQGSRASFCSSLISETQTINYIWTLSLEHPNQKIVTYLNKTSLLADATWVLTMKTPLSSPLSITVSIL